MQVVDFVGVPDGTRVFFKRFSSGERDSFVAPMSYDEFYAAFKQWRQGSLIQDAFPKLTVDQREMMMTGITSDEWDEMFAEEPE